MKQAYPAKMRHLIIGSDNWALFSRWYQSERILAENFILIYPRPGYAVDGNTLPQNVKLASSPTFEISSTFIRQAMEEAGTCAIFLHPAVYGSVETN